MITIPLAGDLCLLVTVDVFQDNSLSPPCTGLGINMTQSLIRSFWPAPEFNICIEYSVYDTEQRISCDCRLVAMLRDACDPKSFGSHLYFSYGADITSRQVTPESLAAGSGGQRAEKATHLWGRADPRYVWNTHLSKPLIGELAFSCVLCHSS